MNKTNKAKSSRRTRILLLSAVLAICACTAGFVVSSSVNAETGTQLTVKKFSEIGNNATVVIGEKGDGVPLLWQVLDNSGTSMKNEASSGNGMFLVSKYLFAADSVDGKAPATYNTAISTMNSIYSNCMNEYEKNAILPTLRSDSAIRVYNNGNVKIEGKTYNGYLADPTDPYYIDDPSEVQDFKATNLVESKLFFLSVDEVQTYIKNELGDHKTGLNTVVRRPCLYSFSTPTNYDTVGDDRNWWLRSDSIIDGYKAAVKRVTRTDSTLYNAFSSDGLIGKLNTAETSGGEESTVDKAWLRPGLNLSKQNVRFMYPVKLDNSGVNENFTAATTCTDTLVKNLKEHTSGTTISGNNAWKPAYTGLNDISTNRIVDGNKDIQFSVNGLESGCSVGYFIYKGTEIVRYGAAVDESGDTYKINKNTFYTKIEIFAYKVVGDSLVTSSFETISSSASSGARIGNSLIQNGIVIYLDGKKFRVHDTEKGCEYDRDFTLYNGFGNEYTNNKGIYLISCQLDQFGDKISTNSRNPSYIYGYAILQTQFISNNAFLKAALLSTSFNKSNPFWTVISDDYVQHYKLGRYFNTSDFWTLDEYMVKSRAGIQEKRYVLPVTSLLKEKILMVTNAYALKDTDPSSKLYGLNKSTENNYALGIQLPQEYNYFKVVSSEYNSDNNIVTVKFEGLHQPESLPEGYKSYVSAIITDKKGNILKYGKLKETDGKDTADVDLSGVAQGSSLYVFHEICKDPPSTSTSKEFMHTKYISNLDATHNYVSLNYLEGTLSIIGDTHRGDTVRLSLSEDSNFSLTDTGISIKWGLYKHSTRAPRFDGDTDTKVETCLCEISEYDNKTFCKIPNKYKNDTDIYIKAIVTSSSKQGKISTDKQLMDGTVGEPVIKKAEQLISRSWVFYGDYPMGKKLGTVFENNTAIRWQVLDALKGNATNAGDTLYEGDEKSGTVTVSNDKAFFMLSDYSLASENYNNVDKSAGANYYKWDGSDAQIWCRSFYYVDGLSDISGVINETGKTRTVEKVADFESGEINATLSVNKNDTAERTFSTDWSQNSLVNDRFFNLSANELGTYYEGKDFKNKSYSQKYIDDKLAARMCDSINGSPIRWWLRSTNPSGEEVNTGAGTVSTRGKVNKDDVAAINGMRPAVNLNRNRIAFASLAVDGKNTEVPNFSFVVRSSYSWYNTLKSVSLDDIDIETRKDVDSVGWKLTIMDEAHSGFKVSSIVYKNKEITFTYKGAKTGTNEYISLIRKDSEGNIVGYHKLLKLGLSSNTDGSLTVSVPERKEGEVDYIINEQCNANYQTDYCSGLALVNRDYRYKIVTDGANITTDPASVPIEQVKTAPQYSVASGETVKIKYTVPNNHTAVSAYYYKYGDEGNKHEISVDTTNNTISYKQPAYNVVVVVSYKDAVLTIVNQSNDDNIAFGMRSDESAIFAVVEAEGENPKTVYVDIPGGGAKSVKGLSTSKYYYVYQLKEWAWRYSNKFSNTGAWKLRLEDTYNSASLVNEYRLKIKIGVDGNSLLVVNPTNAKKWLCGETVKAYRFKQAVS